MDKACKGRVRQKKEEVSKVFYYLEEELKFIELYQEIDSTSNKLQRKGFEDKDENLEVDENSD